MSSVNQQTVSLDFHGESGVREPKWGRFRLNSVTPTQLYFLLLRLHAPPAVIRKLAIAEHSLGLNIVIKSVIK